MWNGSTEEVEIDVISGSLPLLFGRDFGKKYKLVYDLETDEIFSKEDGR